jgi:hypothetical protein
MKRLIIIFFLMLFITKIVLCADHARVLVPDYIDEGKMLSISIMFDGEYQKIGVYDFVFILPEGFEPATITSDISKESYEYFSKSPQKPGKYNWSFNVRDQSKSVIWQTSSEVTVLEVKEVTAGSVLGDVSWGLLSFFVGGIGYFFQNCGGLISAVVSM